jgi:pimeloyl-ACP methyl ester carboxylesterase
MTRTNFSDTVLPLVLIPGIQGRAEWMGPATSALAKRRRVWTFSLTETDGQRFFDAWIERVDALLDRHRVGRAAILGVSFGGLIALRYAAVRPERAARLLLVSTPGPSWRLDPQSTRYLRSPRLSLPLFAMRAVSRLAPEVLAALPTWPERTRFAAGYAWRAIRSPVSPASMAAWVREWMATDLSEDCRQVTAPTLVITGDERLDRVVPVASTREYLRTIAGARARTLPSTGHVGLLLKPRQFADIVDSFLDEDGG